MLFPYPLCPEPSVLDRVSPLLVLLAFPSHERGCKPSGRVSSGNASDCIMASIRQRASSGAPLLSLDPCALEAVRHEASPSPYPCSLLLPCLKSASCAALQEPLLRRAVACPGHCWRGGHGSSGRRGLTAAHSFFSDSPLRSWRQCRIAVGGGAH